MDYTAEHYDNEDEVLTVSFPAAGDEEAIAHALKAYPGLEMLSRPDQDQGSEVNVLVWERRPHLVLKWVADGADTLDEAIAALEGFVGHLKELREQGCKLDQTVDGGNFILLRPDSQLVPD